MGKQHKCFACHSLNVLPVTVEFKKWKKKNEEKKKKEREQTYQVSIDAWAQNAPCPG